MRFPKILLLISALILSVALLLILRLGSKPHGARTTDSISPLADQAPHNSTKLLSQPQVTPAAEPIAKAPPIVPPTLGEFGLWAEKFIKAGTDQQRGSLLPEGEALAKARREELKKLMQSEPALALRQLIPYSLRKRLPDALKPYLEEPISGRGKLSLIESTLLPGYDGEVPEAWYKAELNRKIYHAFLAGRKPTKPINGIALVGAAIDDVLALYSSPPVLDDAQVADLIQEGKIAKESFCSVSGQTIGNSVVTDLGCIYRTFFSVRR